jgi:NADP-dependent 3-hydroxy acid dehydrogenase YdfG
MNKKRILITGATSGIGAATYELAIKNGHTVFIAGRNEAVLAEMASKNANTFFIKTDVTNVDEVKAMTEAAVQSMGGIDVLLNNAGLGIFDLLEDAKLEDWHTMVDVNIKGVLNVLHTCLPHLVSSTGHIINLGSLASHYRRRDVDRDIDFFHVA